MSENYSEGSGEAAGAEERARDAEWHALLARLLPGVDVGLLVRALRDEVARGAPTPARGAVTVSVRESDLAPAERELHRVRSSLALGASARVIQHSINNPLGALLAEAQLLELDPLTAEQRVAVGRIVDLARRVALVARRLDVSGGTPG